MNTDTDFIKSVVQLGNDSYKSGYDEGFIAGKRAAFDEAKKLIGEAFGVKIGVCPDCEGKGAKTENGVEFCNCDDTTNGDQS